VARAAWAGARSFGVRQLAAAFRSASALAGIPAEGTIPRQQAGLSQSGSKLPFSTPRTRSPGFQPREQFPASKLA